MKSFLIRLPNNKLSCEVAELCIKQASVFGVKLNIFDGVDGYQAEEIFKRDNIKKYPKFLKHDTAGVKGCAASHYLLWKMCSLQKEPFLILEHDGFFIRKLPSNIENTFTDVLKLDSENPYASDYSLKIEKYKKKEIKIINYDLSWGYKKDKAPYGGYFRGAYSYIIKPMASKKLINAVIKNGWVPADKQIGESLLKLQATSSTIVRIHPGYNYQNINKLSLTRNLHWNK